MKTLAHVPAAWLLYLMAPIVKNKFAFKLLSFQITFASAETIMNPPKDSEISVV